jgi:ATP-dependent exoDNAse (exonuclease V) beta subunit
VPEQENAIRAMTIHKAKGLQSPVVIIPYANWDTEMMDYFWASSNVPL